MECKVNSKYSVLVCSIYNKRWIGIFDTENEMWTVKIDRDLTLSLRIEVNEVGRDKGPIIGENSSFHMDDPINGIQQGPRDRTGLKYSTWKGGVSE